MKIGIDCGHCLSGYNTGAFSSDKKYKEELLTREVGKELMSILKQEGHSIVDCTVDKASSNSESLKARVNKANAQTLDWFISVHFNACVNDVKGDGKTTGTEVWLSNSNHTDTAKRIASKMSSLGLKNRGVKKDSHYVTSNTKAKALLVECCFIDDKDDMKLYDPKKFAKAIAEGLLDKTIEVSNPTTNNGKNTETWYRAVCGSFKSKDLAEKRIKELSDKGYEGCFVVAFEKNI